MNRVMGARHIAWFFVGVFGVLILLSLVHVRHHPASSTGVTVGSDMGPANIPLPPGEWEATGVVTEVAPGEISNEPQGTVLKRPWTFRTVCHESCRILFFRETLYGPSVTSLVQQGQAFVANFPPVTVPCAYMRGCTGPRPLSGESHDSYSLEWSSGHTEIVATEHEFQTGCEGVPLPDVTRWHAIRVSPTGEGKPAGASNPA